LAFCNGASFGKIYVQILLRQYLLNLFNDDLNNVGLGSLEFGDTSVTLLGFSVDEIIRGGEGKAKSPLPVGLDVDIVAKNREVTNLAKKREDLLKGVDKFDRKGSARVNLL